MSAPALFTVAGAYSGALYAVGVNAETAARWAVENGMTDHEPAATLATLGVGETWKSHPDARGIRITRIAVS